MRLSNINFNYDKLTCIFVNAFCIQNANDFENIYFFFHLLYDRATNKLEVCHLYLVTMQSQNYLFMNFRLMSFPVSIETIYTLHLHPSIPIHI